ncbi:MAG TPA: TonB-dependent receptor [Sphingomonas sp.]
MTRTTNLLCAAGTLALATIATAAQAQNITVPPGDTAQVVAAPATESDGLTDIVVTAQRRTQSLQNVPIAITALTAADLEAKQIRSTIDIPRLVPNMVGATNVGVGSANTYFIRGLGNTESIATFDPPVGTYVDDIYVSRQNANNFAFFDVDRIEVLRGPQGTLFGRNTTGGAINVILKKPGTTLGGYAEGSYGSFDSWSGRLSIDLPVSEKVLTKISAFGVTSDGYVRNRTTGEDNNGGRGYGFRAAVRVLPTDGITWDLSADYIRDDQVNVPSTLEDGKLYSLTGLSRDNAPFTTLVTGKKGGYHLQNISKAASLVSNLQMEVGGAAISFITGYRDLRQGYLIDFFDGKYPTGGLSLANTGRFKQFSQEVKVNGTTLDDRLTYVVGVFYMRERNRTDFADVFTLDLGTFGVPLVLADRVLGNTVSAPAVYAQFDYKLVDGLTVTVGARYTDEKKTVSVTPNANPQQVLPPFSTADIVAAGVPISNRTKLVTPRFAVQYKPDRDLMLFASATRGFRSGGWNARAQALGDFLAFGPEKAWSYEAGIRSELLDRTLRVNATLFYTSLNGFQLPLGFIRPDGSLSFQTQNGSDFRNRGIEAEILWNPARGLSLFGNLGLQRANYRNPSDAIVAQQGRCRSGDAASCGQGIVAPDGSLATPQRSPRVSLAFGASYDRDIGDYVITPAANATYQSTNYVGTAATENDRVGPEWVANASLFVRPAEGAWKLGVECSNCFNNLFTASSFPPVYKFYNMPRVWRVTTKLTF